MLPVLPAEGAAKRACLDLQVPRQARGGRERLFHLESFQIRDGEEDVPAEVRVDDRADRELDFLHRESRRLLPFFAAQERVVTVEEEKRSPLVPTLGVENRADVRV